MNNVMNLDHLHANPPAPFNPEYREGLGDALSKDHGEWCDHNPNVTRQERAENYKKTAAKLRGSFPSVREKGG